MMVVADRTQRLRSSFFRPGSEAAADTTHQTMLGDAHDALDDGFSADTPRTPPADSSRKKPAFKPSPNPHVAVDSRNVAAAAVDAAAADTQPNLSAMSDALSAAKSHIALLQQQQLIYMEQMQQLLQQQQQPQQQQNMFGCCTCQ